MDDDYPLEPLCDEDELSLFADESVGCTDLFDQVKAVDENFPKNTVGSANLIGKKNLSATSRIGGEGIGQLTVISKTVYSLVANIFKCPVSEEILKNNITLTAPKIPYVEVRQCDPWLKGFNRNIVPEALESEIFTQKFISNFVRVAFPLINILDGLSKGRVTHSRIETLVTDSLLLLSSALENVNHWRRQNVMRTYNINHVKLPEVSPGEAPYLFPSSMESACLNPPVFDVPEEDCVLPDLEITAVSKFPHELIPGNSDIPKLLSAFDKLKEANDLALKAKASDDSVTGEVTESSSGKSNGNRHNVIFADVHTQTDFSSNGVAAAVHDRSKGDNISVNSKRDKVLGVDLKRDGSLPFHKVGKTSSSKVPASAKADVINESSVDIIETEQVVRTDTLARNSTVAKDQEHNTSNVMSESPVSISVTLKMAEQDSDDVAQNSINDSDTIFADDLTSSITIDDSPDNGDGNSGDTEHSGYIPAQEVIFLKSDEEQQQDDEILEVEQKTKPKFLPITGPSPPSSVARAEKESPKYNPINTKKQPLRTPQASGALTDRVVRAPLKGAKKSTLPLTTPAFTPGVSPSQPLYSISGVTTPFQRTVQSSATIISEAQKLGHVGISQFQTLAGQRLVRPLDTVGGYQLNPNVPIPMKRVRYDQPNLNATWFDQPMPMVSRSSPLAQMRGISSVQLDALRGRRGARR